MEAMDCPHIVIMCFIFISLPGLQFAELPPRQKKSNASFYSNRSSTCPSWSYSSFNGTCKCYEQNFRFLCSENGDEGGVLQCHCLTFNNDTNEAEEGNCIYNCDFYRRNNFILNSAYTNLPYALADLNQAMCGRFNRTGTLCGKCQEGMYLRAYAYDMSCIACSGGWIVNVLKYILVAFVPLTTFYVFILLFSINIPSSKFQGFVLFSQIFTSPMILRVSVTDFSAWNKSKWKPLLQTFVTIFGIWNLDFFRMLNLDICFEIAPLSVLSLDFLVAFYPFLLILLTHLTIILHNHNYKLIQLICRGPLFLASKLRRSTIDTEKSTVDAFVTFMLLSYVKTYNVCLDLLVPVTVHSVYSHRKRSAVFMDATLSYFGHGHFWYALSAGLVCLVFVIFPVLILLVYPFTCVQRCLNFFPHRWQILVRVIIDSLQGRYKDGTEPGTKDCRWFSAIPFLLRFAYLIIISLYFSSAILAILVQVIILVAILTILSNPFKTVFSQLTSNFSISMMFMAIVLMIIIGMDYSCISYVQYPIDFPLILYMLMCLIMLYTIFIVTKCVITHRRFCLLN